MTGRMLAGSVLFLAFQSLGSGAAVAQATNAWGGGDPTAFVAEMPSARAQRAACDFKFDEASELMRDQGAYGGLLGQAYGMAMQTPHFRAAAQKLSDPAFPEPFKQYGLYQPRPDEAFRTSYDQAEKMRAAGDSEGAAHAAATARARAAVAFPPPHVAHTAAHLLHAAILHDLGRHAEAEDAALAVADGRAESRRLSDAFHSLWLTEGDQAMMNQIQQFGAESMATASAEMRAQWRGMFESSVSDPHYAPTLEYGTRDRGLCALLERPLLPGEQESLAQLYGRGDVPNAARAVGNLAQLYGRLLAELGYVSPTQAMTARAKMTAQPNLHSDGRLAQLNTANASFREIIEAYPRYAGGPNAVAAAARAVELAENDYGPNSIELAVALALSGREADLRRALSILPSDAPGWLRGRLHGDLGSLLQRGAGGPLMMPVNQQAMKAAMAEFAKQSGGWAPSAFPALTGPQGGDRERLKEAVDHLSIAVAWADSAEDGHLALEWRRALKSIAIVLEEDPQDPLVAELVELDREVLDPQRAFAATNGTEARTRVYTDRREMMIIAKKHPRYAEEQRRAELEYKRKAVHGGEINWSEDAWRHPYARDYLDGRS